MNKSNHFSAFIITFNRPKLLQHCISILSSSSRKPQKTLIINNGEFLNVNEFEINRNESSFSIINNESNVGPAGAAKIGLETLASEGYQWIYWGDDDDPPYSYDTFKELLDLVQYQPNVGIVGKIGGIFDPVKATTRALKNNELKQINEVDYVSGGKQMIVSSKVVKAGVLPDPRLFFGFEELDFCLRVKEAGFKIIINGEEIRKSRMKEGKTSPDYKWEGVSFGKRYAINRQYYSTRNLLFILISRKYYFGYFYLLFKTFGKIFFSFRFGFNYGFTFSKMQIIAIYHHLIGRYGLYKPTK